MAHPQPTRSTRSRERSRGDSCCEKPGGIVAGGGVLYSAAEDLLADFAARRNVHFVETQAGKGAQSWDHAMNFGSPSMTGSACANALCEATIW